MNHYNVRHRNCGSIQRPLVAALLVCVLQSNAAATEGYAPKRVIVSGHSLTDKPYIHYLARIAASRKAPFKWKDQMVPGSPISWRTAGDQSKGVPWAGYGYGTVASDVLTEFKSAAKKERYDTLLITEGHNTVAVILWHDTIRYLRDYHERLIAANSKAQTFLLHPWEDLRDKSKPGPWMSLERNAAKIWRCTAQRVNLSLKAEGRKNRIKSIPLASALVEIVDAISRGQLKGLGAGSLDQRISTVFADNVHLTPLGVYCMSLVTDAFIRKTAVNGVWHPRHVTPETARELQELASRFREQQMSETEQLTLEECRSHMVNKVCKPWNDYVPSEWVADQPDCRQYLGRKTLPNPFTYAADNDANYWHPSP